MQINNKSWLLFIPFLVLFSFACRILFPEPTVVPPVASPTPTPISTGRPTATPTSTETVAPLPTRTPTVTSRAVPAGRVLIVVLGSDFRPGKGYRTDVIMLVTVDTHRRTVTALSFPRDLYVYIPGWQRNRINTAFPRGGFDLLGKTFELNFGLRPDFYVLANMQGLTGLVDSLDGITVEVPRYLKDRCDRSLDLADDDGYCEVEPGPVEMDGETALWYVRSRSSSSDFDRLRRAQEVLLAIFSKMMSLKAVAKWPQFYAACLDFVETNMDSIDILPLLPAAVQVERDPSRIRRYAVTQAETTPFRSPTGASVLLPDYGKIAEIIDQAVYAP